MSLCLIIFIYTVAFLYLAITDFLNIDDNIFKISCVIADCLFYLIIVSSVVESYCKDIVSKNNKWEGD